ncbi:SpoIIE family protein phosphatase [Lentisphaerota bacterium WC36G]|nr:SpoIIE family protein phosphatase [Lentisphaerae bacterium WC36]
MDLPITLIVLFCIIFIIMLAYCFVISNRNYFLRAKIRDALHRKAEISNFLNLFSRNLSTSQEVHEAMDMTARYVADFTEARGIIIFDREGKILNPIGFAGNVPNLQPLPPNIPAGIEFDKLFDSFLRRHIMVGDGIIGSIVTTGNSVFIDNGFADHRIQKLNCPFEIHSLMAVPMLKEGHVAGVICAVNNRSNTNRPFSNEQFSRFKFIAQQVLLAQNFVDVYSTLSEQQRINQELEVARELQASFLPEAFPNWDQFKVDSFTRSAKEVSGDFFDFVEIDQDRMLVVLGDATGKGIPACMIVAMTRSFIRSAVRDFTTLEELLIELNDNLFRDTDAERFITLACCLLDKKNNTIEYCRGGHTDLFTFIRGHVRKISPHSSALGLLPSDFASFDTITLEFNPHMSLLLFSDGISEALNNNQEEYGVERLEKVYFDSRNNEDLPEQTVSKILASVDEFVKDEPQSDDQTIVLIQHL